MYPYDFFLPKHKHNIRSERELSNLLTKLYPDSVLPMNQGSLFKSLLAMILHICGPISLSALKVFLGDYLVSDSSRSRISRYVKQKLIKSYKLVTNDMNSRTLYAPTLELCSPLMSSTSDLYDELIKHRGNKAPLHSYGIGLSHLNLIQLGIPFDYLTQVKHSNAYNNDDNMIVDSEIVFWDNHTWMIYLEQDMGTERAHVLYNKLVSYSNCRLFRDKRSYVVFSSHASIPYLDIPAFDMLLLQKIAAYMESTICNDILTFYEMYNSFLGAEISIALIQLLVVTGSFTAYSSGNKELQVENVDDSSTLVKNNASTPFTLNNLYQYIKDLQNDSNPYRLGLYIQKQYMLCKRKFKNLVNTIIHNDNTRLMNDLREGTSLFFTPSMMLNNNYFYFSPEDSGYNKLLKNILSEHLPAIRSATYALNSPRIVGNRDYPSLIFRNCFMSGDTVSACVEYISQDIAGYIRVLNYAWWYQEYHYPLTLICLCDSKQDAFDFVKHADCLPISSEFSFKLYFMLATDLSDKSRLYYIEKDNSNFIWKTLPYRN